MLTCPSCGQVNPDGFRHCGMCGSVLATPAAPRMERKVVSVLFCDLVGFTSRAEGLDPEDVQALLGPYHARVRDELVRHGGTVEKFIGDAVMALFGAPVAHEDDPERAVRAALAIRDREVEAGLELRLGVTTGEALITLGAQRDDGAGLASGDVVNTASRLQTAAPVNGILVDATTQRATRAVIEYAAAAPVRAKGKRHPVDAWLALRPRSRAAPTSHPVTAELVGRARERDVLRGALERMVTGRSPQQVTLVGAPGMGKSRLVYELRRMVDEHDELITWRQGRCLAYGDGIAYWALGEIVKAQAGVLETDSDDEAATKIRDAVGATIGDRSERDWITGHLRTLVGRGPTGSVSGDRRRETFVAWRSYLEALSDQRPLVLVFEDLHWADDGLLDFIDLLVDQVGDVPLLVVTTARPELLERRPGWGGGKHDATTLDLSPLSDDQTERIIEHVLQRVVLPQETRLILLERAGGNPLYAEQFSELYLERGSAESLPPPETLQGIIAARIDGLPDSEKAVLQDASVVGKVFWPGALGRAAAELDAPLASLARKGFLTRRRRSSVADEDEWAFAHILLRDVAYAQIARADRSDKHQRTAVWLEALGRPEEHAALIAYHWHTAYELAHAAGQPVTALEEPTRLALRAAGERAFAINAYPEAARHFEAALALWPADDRQRPGLRYRQAEALFTADTPDAPDVLKTIRDEFAASGQRELHAGTELMLSILARHAGWTDDARSHEAAAEALVGDSTSLIATRVQSYGARRRVVFSGDVELGSEMAARALSMADAVDSDELRVHALETIGIAKLYQGRPGGRDDLEAALAIATSVRSPRLSGLTSNLAVLAFREMRYRRAHELTVEALRIAKQLGDAARVRLGRAHMASDQLILGDWDEAMRNADAFIAECEAGAASDSECDLRGDRAIVRAARGDLDGANDDALRALDLARAQGSPQDVLPALSMAILVFEETGSDGDLGVLSSELVELAERNAHEAPWSLGLGFPCSRVAGRHAESVRRVLDAAPDSPYKPLVLACLDGDFARAADMFEEAGSPTWEARLRLRAAEALAEAGRRDESRTQARLALAFHRKVGANRYIERERQLLEGSA